MKIGVSARLMHHVPPELGFRNKTLQYIEQSIAHWIMAHGAIAYMVPAVGHDSLLAARHLPVSAFVEELDGLVLQGGADVAPESYGETPLDPRWKGDAVRDRYELALLRAFIAQGKPVVGVCRGCQLLNVAFGGTLYQDIATQRPDAQAHVDPELFDQLEHRVRFAPGSRLAELYGGLSELSVTSIHHQSIKTPGKEIAVEAVSAHDGIVEAIRWTGTGYVVGVQWHPEFHLGRSSLADSAPIMLEFLHVARRAALDRLRVAYPTPADLREPRAPVLLPQDKRTPA
jgi:putative glutamine amidotransferase